jgi:hypothetical protein
MNHNKSKNYNIPTGSDESTMIASYFPLGACRRKSAAVKNKTYN